MSKQVRHPPNIDDHHLGDRLRISFGSRPPDERKVLHPQRQIIILVIFAHLI